jgi:hypothetical protein
MGVNEIRVLNHSLSIMRDIDLSGSALYIKICLNTSATLIMNKCLNESCVYSYRILAHSSTFDVEIG